MYPYDYFPHINEYEQPMTLSTSFQKNMGLYMLFCEKIGQKSGQMPENGLNWSIL